MADISKIKIFSNVYDIKDTTARNNISTLTETVENLNNIEYVLCETAASTAAKIGVCSNFTLKNPCYIYVNITNSNTSESALTLNINNIGAKSIYIDGAASSATNYTLPAGTYIAYYTNNIFYFRTDGQLPNPDILDRLDRIPYYGVCTTNTNTGVYEVTIPGLGTNFISDKTSIIVRFVNGCEYSPSTGSLTLNVNNSGNYSISNMRGNDCLGGSSSGAWIGVNEIAQFIYYEDPDPNSFITNYWKLISPSVVFEAQFAEYATDAENASIAQSLLSVTCSTNASTANKAIGTFNDTTITISAVDDQRFTIYFENGNTANNPKIVYGNNSYDIYTLDGTMITTGPEKYLLKGYCDFLWDNITSNKIYLLNKEIPSSNIQTITNVAGGITTVTLNHDDDARGDEIEALTVTFGTYTPEFYASLAFTSGSTPTAFTIPSSVLMSGKDCKDNVFVPVANTRYNILFWYDSSYLIGGVVGNDIISE